MRGNIESKDEKRSKVILVANLAKEHVLKFHVPTIKMLKENGWEIDVACGGEEDVPYCDRRYIMSYKRSPFTFATIKGISELKKIIDDNEYDIVYCHTPVGGLVARLATKISKKKDTKVIYFSHGYHFYKGSPKLNWIVFYSIEKLLSVITDSIIVVNNEDYKITVDKFKNKNTYQINGIGVNTDRLVVDDYEEIRFKYREEMNISKEAIVLIYLAELIDNKNQILLMDVLKILLEKNNDVYLLLAGVDYTNGKFIKYAKDIGVYDNIRFLGWREDIGNLYAMSDICTASSIREGFGINLVEAMSSGIPVVATKNRAHKTIIRDGENGFLVDLGSVREYATKVELLIENKEIREKFIRTGINEKSKFDSETIVKEIKKILDENINQK